MHFYVIVRQTNLTGFLRMRAIIKKIDVYKQRPEIRDKNIKCPECGSIDCIPIIYELPSEENKQAVMKAVIIGKVIY